MDLKDLYITLHTNTKEYTFFSVPYGTFSKIGHILRHKASLNKYKKIEIILFILSGLHGLNWISTTTGARESFQTYGNGTAFY